MNPVFSAAELEGPSTIEIALQVVDATGKSSPVVTTTVTINAVAPTAVFTGSTVTLGSPGAVAFSDPYDPSTAETMAGFTYSYDFADSGTFEIVGSSSPTATVPAAYLSTVGSHLVRGRIAEPGGDFTDYTAVVQVNAPPSIAATPPANQSATAGAAQSFSLGTFAETNATGPYSNDVNWGDGSGDTVFPQSAVGTINPQSHTYAGAATDVVGVTIIDALEHESNTAKFDVSVTPPVVTATKLVIASQPSGGVAGAALTPAITVQAQNAQGSLATTDTSTVTLSILTGPTGGTLVGTATAKVVGGIATFPGLSLNFAGVYTLKATDGSLASATSPSIIISPAAASKLAIIRQPTTGTAGVNLSPGLTASIEDAFGNVVTSNTSTVTVAIASSPTGATLAGTATANAVNGIASFTGLSLKVAGVYTLKATDGSLASATSNSVSITAAAASKLVFAEQPTTGTHGVALSPGIVVDVEDSFGNEVTTDASAVTLAIASGPSGGSVSGTLVVKAVKGVVAFGKLTPSKAGTYTFKATDSKLATVTSNDISIK